MKIGKIVACMLFFMFFCGFKVDYDLSINDELVLKERVKFDFENGNNDFVKSFNTYLPVDKDDGDYISDSDKFGDINYYNIEKNKNFSSIDFNFDHTIESLNNDFFSNYCYRYVTIMNSYNDEKERDELLLSTSKSFLCFENETNLESVTINIHTERKVYSSNADTVDDDTYTWKINKNNKDDAVINMVVDGNFGEESIPFWERNLLFLIAIGIFIIGGIIFLIMKKHSDKINEI